MNEIFLIAMIGLQLITILAVVLHASSNNQLNQTQTPPLNFLQIENKEPHFELYKYIQLALVELSDEDWERTIKRLEQLYKAIKQ